MKISLVHLSTEKLAKAVDPPTKVCAFCGKVVRIHKDGLMYKHKCTGYHA